MVGEELKWRRLAVFLAHEQHRHKRRQQRPERGQRPRLRGHPIAEGPIADLVVILGEDDESLHGYVVGGRAEPAAAKRGVAAIVDVRAVHRLGEVRHRAEVSVVAVVLVGDQRPQRVMEVVGPGGVAVVSAKGDRAHDPRIVHAGLGDHVGVGLERVHAAGDCGDDVLGAGVEDRVDCVQAQPVEADL